MKQSRLRGLITVLLGLFLLLSNLDKPRIAALHGSDVLRLVACGVLFGVGLSRLLGRFRLPSEK